MTMEKVSSKEYAVGSMQTAYCLLFTFLHFLLLTSLYAQDFSLELMKSRASLDAVVQEAELTRLRIQRFEDSRNWESSIFNLKSIMVQADSISDAIERLREEFNCHSERSEESQGEEFRPFANAQGDTRQWEVSFGRKIACIHLSIKALKAEIDKYLCMGTAI